MRKGKATTFLTRLARDKAGNTLALVAAGLIPLIGLVGGAVDMSRLYLTKSRLQQACDAGVLAGRKSMGSGSWTTTAEGHAKSLFSGNFKSGAYGTGGLLSSFSENQGEVTGTASADVPMTLMHLFGFDTRTLSVTCTAKMELPNTDVMFVLDVTGSMNCVAGDTACGNNNNVPAAGSKIIGLKSAIKCFYEALAKVNTTEVCGSDPTATTYTQSAQIRFGFMPYASNVNVGKLLPQATIANSWVYQSREANVITGTSTIWETHNQTLSKAECELYMNNQATYGFTPSPTTLGGAPYDRVTVTFPTDGTASGGASGEWGWTGAPTTSGTYRSCRRLRTETVTQVNSQRIFKNWNYKQVTFNVSGLKGNNGAWNNSVTLPIGSNGSDTSVTWDGCIEERQTFQNTDGNPSDDWSPIPTSAFDMDINMPPTSDTKTQWGPMLGQAVWGRYTGNANSPTYVYNDMLQTTSNLDQSLINYSCPTQASRLRTYTTPTDLETYVNSLTAIGNTYHDIGMIWGARFISPTGIFAADNAQTTSGGQIQRHIIFMTDGDVRTFDIDYNAYGASYWDRRQKTGTPDNSPFSNNYSDNNNYNNMNNARLAALCTTVKNMNITLWVISYGGGINAATETRLSNCATSGHYFAASNNAALISRFRQIASEISDLRLTQ